MTANEMVASLIDRWHCRHGRRRLDEIRVAPDIYRELEDAALDFIPLSPFVETRCRRRLFYYGVPIAEDSNAPAGTVYAYTEPPHPEWHPSYREIL